MVLKGPEGHEVQWNQIQSWRPKFTRWSGLVPWWVTSFTRCVLQGGWQRSQEGCMLGVTFWVPLCTFESPQYHVSHHSKGPWRVRLQILWPEQWPMEKACFSRALSEAGSSVPGGSQPLSPGLQPSLTRQGDKRCVFLINSLGLTPLWPFPLMLPEAATLVFFLPFSHHKAFSLCLVSLWKTQSNGHDLSS